jgi:two-component system, NarL family, sensor histidine kinase BarA
MLARIRSYIDKLLKILRLKPLSLAEKCRLLFAAAVLLILSLALLVPYYWMGKLTDKIALDSGRAVADVFFRNAPQIEGVAQEILPALEKNWTITPQPNSSIQWLRFDDADKSGYDNLSQRQKKNVETLKQSQKRPDIAWIEKEGAISQSNYIKIFRATESYISGNPEAAASFSRNQPIGVLIIQAPAAERAKIILMNRIWTIVAGLLAAAGAMVAFYAIAQRIILRPIRQLRSLVNNIAEGNLNARSSIKSDDEYEKLSDAFNAMLDGLQGAQEKLRQANKQLDAKIAQLSDRNIELFRANKLKSEFLANMSHEFRTPLNAILGFAQLLGEKPADNIDKSKRYAENIITSGRSLLNMINDLLDLAKAEAGKMKLRIEKTSIQQLCSGLVAFFSPLIEQKKIKVKLDITTDIPLVSTDSGKLQQIFYNLLSNAVKFTPEAGKIKISAKMLDDLTVRIAIADTGTGISQQDQEKIFEKFRQIDGSITRPESGTGLGLAICKELTELLAGTISLESNLGEGSTFYVDIPVSLPAEQPDQNQDESE